MDLNGGSWVMVWGSVAWALFSKGCVYLRIGLLGDWWTS